MSQYLVENTILDTKVVSGSWKESTRWNGEKNVSKATGDWWAHQTLYRTPDGRYFMEFTSDYPNDAPNAYFVKPYSAAYWLKDMGHKLPDDLSAYAEKK